MGGEVLVLGIIGLLTWLIPLFGLPIPIIGLAWGIVLLRRKPQRVWLVRSGVILCSLGLALSAFYTTIDILNPPAAPIEGLPSDYTYEPPPYVEPGSVGWQADGEITDGEYFNTKPLGEVGTIYWNSDGQYIEVGMKVATTGWVAFSIQQELSSYRNVDMILGYAGGGRENTVYDLWSDVNPNLRAQDIILGGKNDILEFGAGEFTEGDASDDDEAITYTVIEFKRAYSTGDTYDQVLTSGLNVIFWSYGPDDSSNSAAIGRDVVSIELE